MIKKFFYNLPFVICYILLAWISLSYIDIISDNLRAVPLHSNYNIFILLSEVIGR